MKNKKSDMVNLKYLVLLICFAQILYYSAADNSTSALGSVIHDVIPDCFFGVQTISFILYTREIENGVVFTMENITSNDELKQYFKSLPVVFLIHGFTSNANNSGYRDLTAAILAKKEVAIISIDWKEDACSGGFSLFEPLFYGTAVQNTPIVGQYVANLTGTLISNLGANIDQMIIIGHSLGAHVAGYAGKEVQKQQLGIYPLLIGLDPANPFYEFEDCSERLCITDASFVQIIHTTMTLGMSQAIGNIDFYMNRGHLQPGCLGNPVCSHSRAVEYLTQSVNHECCFIGTPWTNYLFTQPISSCTNDSCVCVGLNAEDYPARGKFYVEIEHDPPYCNNNGTVL